MAGADAYAIDPRYNDLPGLVAELESQVACYDWKAQGNVRRELGMFEAAVTKRPSRYIGASATSIPLPDNYFDVVCSTAALFGYLDLNYSSLVGATTESLRVATPRGSVRTQNYGKPVGRPLNKDDKARLVNQQLLMSWLSRAQPVELKTYQFGEERVLQIDKL